MKKTKKKKKTYRTLCTCGHPKKAHALMREDHDHLECEICSCDTYLSVSDAVKDYEKEEKEGCEFSLPEQLEYEINKTLMSCGYEETVQRLRKSILWTASEEKGRGEI